MTACSSKCVGHTFGTWYYATLPVAYCGDLMLLLHLGSRAIHQDSSSRRDGAAQARRAAGLLLERLIYFLHCLAARPDGLERSLVIKTIDASHTNCAHVLRVTGTRNVQMCCLAAPVSVPKRRAIALHSQRCTDLQAYFGRGSCGTSSTLCGFFRELPQTAQYSAAAYGSKREQYCATVEYYLLRLRQTHSYFPCLLNCSAR